MNRGTTDGLLILLKLGVQITVENMNKSDKAAFSIDGPDGRPVFLKVMEKSESFVVHREILEKREWMIYREDEM